MTLIDFIGFIVTMLLLIFWMMRQAWQVQKKPLKESEEVENPSEELKDLLKSLDIELEGAAPKPPPPPPKKKKTQGFIPSEKPHQRRKKPEPAPTLGSEAQLDISETVEHQDLSRWERDAYEIKEKKREARIEDLLDTLPEKRNMVLYKVILDQPRGLQKEPWHEYNT